MVQHSASAQLAGYGPALEVIVSRMRVQADQPGPAGDHRLAGLGITQGCRLMGLARSTCHDAPAAANWDAKVVARIEAVGEEFETYGYRRIGAGLRPQRLVVNSKQVRRLMREHDLQPRRRRRYTVTTDTDHEEPLFKKTPGWRWTDQPAPGTASRDR